MSDEPAVPDLDKALELVSLFCGTEATQVDEKVIRAPMMNPFTRQPIDFRAQYDGSADDEGWVVQFFEDYDAADRGRLSGQRAPELAAAIIGAWAVLSGKYLDGVEWLER
ncbi:hypothetical protein HBA53_23575 (plasmid) [Rhodococcus pyridinivorans]|uniref:hypothetical protein n=1 Tax=Rhodococcus TaxID=1827 RepID=UPI00110DC054|nr:MULTISPECIES: hypothetical protein [Rhodococcus]MBX4171426.1 hypothetical protein [Rhodococcus sp. DMU2021]QXF84096.1 hypothetical protein HBA53_23575 [Rhodococcus pyridinivorans]